MRENQLAETTRPAERWVEVKAFAISGGMLYAEYNRRLFKWRLDDSEWTDAGLVDLGKVSDDNLRDKVKVSSFGRGCVRRKTGRALVSIP